MLKSFLNSRAMLKTMACILAVSLICTMSGGLGFSAFAVEPAEENYFVTQISSTGDGVAIVDYFGPGGAVVIPDSIGGQTVTEIAATAFGNNATIERGFYVRAFFVFCNMNTAPTF